MVNTLELNTKFLLGEQKTIWQHSKSSRVTSILLARYSGHYQDDVIEEAR